MCQSTSLELKQFHYMMLKWEWKVKWKCSSLVSDSSRPHELQPTRLLCLWNSPGKNTGVDCHSLLQGIFPTQGLNPGLLITGRFFTIWARREEANSDSMLETVLLTCFLVLLLLQSYIIACLRNTAPCLTANPKRLCSAHREIVWPWLLMNS